MPEMIDKDALKNDIDMSLMCDLSACFDTNLLYSLCACFKEIVDRQPKIEAVPVRHGYWIFGSTSTSSWMKCSECLKSQSGQTATFSYCPNCGAKMDLRAFKKLLYNNS